MALLKLQPQQEAEARLVNITDARGRPARFDGVPTWESSAPGTVDLRPAADGLSCLIGSLDAEGAATVTVTGDARQGEEIVPITGVLSVVVAAGDVAVFEIAAGEARDRAAPVPPAA